MAFVPVNILTILTLLLFVFARSSAASSATTDDHAVVIRLYPQMTIGSPTLQRMVTTIVNTFAPAVNVHWHVCTARQTIWNSRCDTPLGPGELALRLIDGPSRVAAGVLGVAVTTPSAKGQLATVYVDRVRRAALAAGMDSDTLLGHVGAHELAHLLLRQGAHCRTG
jgi:hypothetical protein